MKVNFGFFISKTLRWLNKAALRDCEIHPSSKVGTGSNCIQVKMGRYSYMGKNNSCCHVEIGAFCSIASYCAIGGGVHDPSAVSTSPVFHAGRNIFHTNLADLSSPEARLVKIGNDVWIGEKVFIKDGITIGDGAVIGAHSVVTHDIPPYAIVAGAPARILKYRFRPEQIEKLLEMQWWNWSEEKLKEQSSQFQNIEEFLK